MDVGVLLGLFGLEVDGISFDVDCLDGADEFAASATYAEVGSGFGDGQTALKRNHVDGLDGAVLGAGSATGAVHVDYADILVEYHAAGLSVVLLLNRERTYGAGGADLAAEVAVIVAVTLVELHYRLHHASQAILHAGGLEHVAGALAYAEVAGCAVVKQVLMAYRSRRRHGYARILYTCYFCLKSGRSKRSNYQC